MSPSTSDAPSTTAAPASSPTSGAHEHSVLNNGLGDTAIARWNACRTSIRYQVRVGQASSDQILYLNDAIAAVEQATGFDFQFVGTTTSSDWTAHQTDPNVDALILFNTEAEDPGLLGTPIGMGGSRIVGIQEQPNELFAVRDKGSARLEVDYVPSPGSPWSYEDEWRALILHELGHMVGLSHVGDITEVMYPINFGVQPFQNGDLEGLWTVGTAQPCPPSGPTNFAAPEMIWDIQH